jgi:uncharacterized protein YecE (DUF72 family)
MRFHVGTSGYSYAGWKPSFYPAKLPQKEMLSFYATKFPTVELNNTFYRLPGENMVAAWVGQVPGVFRFAVKAPQTITHRKRLKVAGAETEQLFDTLAVFKDRLGPVLFGLPPNFKKDVPRLKDFLASIKDRPPAAFEFRHDSWFDDEVFECLRAHGRALGVADGEDLPAPKLVDAANWGYVRLRRDTYTDRELGGWVEKLRSRNWTEAYVYFKHDDEGVGPKLAARFLELAGG